MSDAQTNPTELPAADAMRRANAELQQAVAALRAEVEQRKQAERELRASRDELRRVTDRAPVMLVHCDAEGRYKFVNRPYAQHFGLEPEDLVGKLIPEIVGGPAYEHFLQQVKAALVGERIEFEAAIPHDRLGPRMMHCAYEPELDAAGDVCGFVATIQDVTERARAQEQLRELNATLERRVDERTQRLREHEQWLAATLSGIADGVIATDLTGRVCFLNAVAEEITGWPQAQALAADMPTVFPLRDQRTRQSVPDPTREALLKGRRVGVVEAVLTTKGGAERLIDANVAALRDADGLITGAVLVCRDVGERRRREERLRQAQKMEAVARLAGGTAHHLNNLMTTVTGFSDVLLQRLPDGDGLRACVEHIKNAGLRAASLAGHLLAFGQRQALQPERLDLNALLADTVPALRALLEGGIELVLEPDPALPPVLADPRQVKQILITLALNAGEAMPGGGRLTVQTRAGESGPALVVRDTGRGIDGPARESLFEPFASAKGLGSEPRGLGLASVYGTVTQSGGHVEVQSERGRGTAMTVFLPAAERADGR
jgi:PAS domain S-box-containing protein